jgi:hypothetical protein
MRWKPHVRFGGRARETHQPRGGRRALVRPHLANSQPDSAGGGCRTRPSATAVTRTIRCIDAGACSPGPTSVSRRKGRTRLLGLLDAGDPHGEVRAGCTPRRSFAASTNTTIPSSASPSSSASARTSRTDHRRRRCAPSGGRWSDGSTRSPPGTAPISATAGEQPDQAHEASGFRPAAAPQPPHPGAAIRRPSPLGPTRHHHTLLTSEEPPSGGRTGR